MSEGIRNILHLIDATKLVQYADNRDAEGKLPEIIRRLITSTCNPDYIRMPSGDSVQNAGWDGEVINNSPIKNPYVPNGNSYWELSKNKNSPRKAELDFNKRTIALSEDVLSESVFIFVTLRRWPSKHKWIDEKKKSSKWKDIKVYDADDLEHWLEIAPSVGLWLVSDFGILPSDNALPLSIFWEEWISSTDPPIDEDLVLKLQPNSLKEISDFLTDAKNNYLSISSTEKNIAIAYFAAVILSLTSDEHRHSFLSRSVIVKDINAFRKLMQEGYSLILIPTFDEALISIANNNGHKVFLPKTGGINKEQEIYIKRLSVEDISCYLKTKSQMHELVARRIASMTHGSISILRRKIAKEGHIKIPEWAVREKATQLLPLMLAGSWDSNCIGDKEIISKLGKKPYEEIEAIAHSWINVENPPIRKIGSIYSLISHEYIYEYLIEFLTPSLLDLMCEVCIDVFSEIDPKYEMDPEQRIMAPIYGKINKYSYTLRNGLANSLVLLKINSSDNKSELLNNNQKIADTMNRIFHTLYSNKISWKFWASIADVQTLFAEASPEIFLQHLEITCRNDNNDLRVLFKQTSEFEGCYYANILWALECCAWNRIYLDRVAEILILLSFYENENKKWSNRPSGSLSSIFSIQFPQTSALLKERFDIIDRLEKKYPKEIMQLLFSIVPSNMTFIFPRHKPKYHDWADYHTDAAPNLDVMEATKMVLDRIHTLIKKYPEGWINIIEKIWEIPFKDYIDRFLDSLVGIDRDIYEEDKMIEIWRHLDHVIHYHKKYHHDLNGLDEEIITKLERAYERLTPKDPVLKWSRIFSQDADLHITETKDWREESRLLFDLQIKAVTEVYNYKKIDGLLHLSELVESPAYIGRAAACVEELYKNDFKFILSYINDNNVNIKELIRGFILKRYEQESINWIKDFIKLNEFNDDSILLFFLMLPLERKIWDLLEIHSISINDLYWEKVQINWYLPKNEDIEYIANQLRKHNRASGAFFYLSHWNYKKESKINSELFLSVLKNMGNRDDDPDIQVRRHNFVYNLSIMFHKLAECSDVDKTELAMLEWKLMPFGPYGSEPTNLIQLILSDANVFSQFLEITFLPHGSSLENKKPVTKQQEDLKFRGYDFLNGIKDSPGIEEDGSLNSDDLKKWILHARELCANNHRLEKCDFYIGKFMANAPIDCEDSYWPHKTVRDLLDEIDNDEIVKGMENGLYNNRGGTVKELYEGGKQERELAERYRNWANQCRGKWKRITEVLDYMVSRYEYEADRNDIMAEQERFFEE